MPEHPMKRKSLWDQLIDDPPPWISVQANPIKRKSFWVWVSVVCLIIGGLLSLESAIPYHVSIADARGFIGPAVVAGACVLWLSDAQPRNLYFGIVFGGTAALIDKDKILVGLVGLALVCVARFIQLKIEKN
jgi:hypothetical protein